jgi:hypothetical protein
MRYNISPERTQRQKGFLQGLYNLINSGKEISAVLPLNQKANIQHTRFFNRFLDLQWPKANACSDGVKT